MKLKSKITVGGIAAAIEGFAPLPLQEGYDNAGLQVGFADRPVSAVLLCLDVTEEVLNEALRRKCDMIISHHPLIFRGLKNLTGADDTQRIVIKALESGIAIYSAHTNQDSTWNGVSHEMAHMLEVSNLSVLAPKDDNDRAGIGVIGDIKPTPKLEFLRRIKEKFNVKALRYSTQSDAIVIKKVALCGGSGASLIAKAIERGADLYVTGDVKYHDFTAYGKQIVIADIGHYESELCSAKIFSRIIRQRYPELVVYFSEEQKNPIGII